MVGLTENIQACLRDFQTGTASMARKRHLASTAGGVFGLCLMASQDTMPHIALCCLERLRRTDDVTTILTGHDATHGALLPGGQYHE